MTYEEIFRWTWEKRGKTKEEIDGLWREHGKKMVSNKAR